MILQIKDALGNWVNIPAIKGAKGDKGETGEIGPQGPQGEVGPQGPQGEAGTGDMLASVYDPAGKASQIATEEELESKANKTETSTYTMLASEWSEIINADHSSFGYYSFESMYPSETFDITIELNGDYATYEQIEAWSNAKIIGSATENKAIAKGDVPTVDIAIIVKAVRK